MVNQRRHFFLHHILSKSVPISYIQLDRLVPSLGQKDTILCFPFFLSFTPFLRVRFFLFGRLRPSFLRERAVKGDGGGEESENRRPIAF